MNRAAHAAENAATSALMLALLAVAALILAVLWVASRTAALSVSLPKDGES